MQRVEVIGLGVENLPVEPLGLVHLAVFVMRVRALQQRGEIDLWLGVFFWSGHRSIAQLRETQRNESQKRGYAVAIPAVSGIGTGPMSFGTL